MKRRFWTGAIVTLVFADVTGGTHLWWLLASQRAPLHSVAALAESSPSKDE